MSLKTILVEDEQLIMDSLEVKLSNNCPQVDIIAKCLTGESAIKAIHEKKPDLVFLDFELGTMTGFDVLDRLKHIPFEVIFTTNFDQYAIEALNEYDPVYYLLKPINDKKLVEAAQKADEIIRQKRNKDKEQILLHSQRTIDPITLNEIVYCKADNVSTEVYFLDGSRKVVSQTLKKFTERLPSDKFYRTHKSYTVRLNAISTITREDGKLYCVLPPKGEKIPVAQDKKQGLLDLF